MRRRAAGAFVALLAPCAGLVVPAPRHRLRSGGLRRRQVAAPVLAARRGASDGGDAPFPLAATPKAAEAAEAERAERYQVYGSRWAMLGMLSLLAFVSDWVCFATAATPNAFASATGRDAAEMIDLFLFANVFACFLFTDVTARLGLRTVIVGAAATMTLGCALRSGIDPSSLPPIGALKLGTVLVGVSQPFFQCAPPLLSATWFPANERALATAAALNANQLGIAAAFLVGGSVVTDAAALPAYFRTIFVASAAATAIAAAFFASRPPTPPTASAAAALGGDASAGPRLAGLRFPCQLAELLVVPGFLASLAAFVASSA